MTSFWYAKVRLSNSGKEFTPVTWGGLNYYTNKNQLEMLVTEMQTIFPQNEYIIEEYSE
ncbi:hypothetical protein [Caudoviricetes sp.]|nr:hypothetical protein [Caudoviricetes sp.]